MKIIGTVETILTGTIAQSETDCATNTQGFDSMQRTLQEGTRLISVRVER